MCVTACFVCVQIQYVAAAAKLANLQRQRVTSLAVVTVADAKASVPPPLLTGWRPSYVGVCVLSTPCVSVWDCVLRVSVCVHYADRDGERHDTGRCERRLEELTRAVASAEKQTRLAEARLEVRVPHCCIVMEHFVPERPCVPPLCPGASPLFRAVIL